MTIRRTEKYLKKILSSVWLSCILDMVEMGFVLMAIAETHRQFKPGLSRKGPARPDRLNILGDQAFYIDHRNPVMDSQMVPAYFYCFGIVDLVHMFCIFSGNIHMCGYLHTEVMQDCPCPYFLDNIFIFFGMKGFQA